MSAAPPPPRALNWPPLSSRARLLLLHTTLGLMERAQDEGAAREEAGRVHVRRGGPPAAGCAAPPEQASRCSALRPFAL